MFPQSAVRSVASSRQTFHFNAVFLLMELSIQISAKINFDQIYSNRKKPKKSGLPNTQEWYNIGFNSSLQSLCVRLTGCAG